MVLGFAGALDATLAAAAADGADPGRLAAALVRRERAPLRAVPGDVGAGEAGRRRWPQVLHAVLTDGVPERPEHLGGAAGGRLAALGELRRELAGDFPGIALGIDLAEFAGHTLEPSLAPAGRAAERAYYDGLVFRAYRGAVALPAGGGGRYDRLFGRLGAPVPAVGFTLGLDRLGGGGPAGAAGAAAEEGR